MKLEEGRVAFITGGGEGIGRATAKMLAELGVLVASFDINDEANRELEKTCCNIQAITCDCTRPEQIQTSFQSAMERYGRVDILINNAGDFLLSSLLKDDFWQGQRGLEHMLRLFVGSTYGFSQLASQAMARLGEGEIINVLTNHLHRDRYRVSPEEHAYDAAKYAQLSLNMSMAAELAPYGIRVNAVDPAATYTKMLQNFFQGKGKPNTAEGIAAATQAGTVLMPEDVALAICNLIRWEEPAPVGQNYLLQSRKDCEQLKLSQKEAQWITPWHS